ncbi:VOC family protein [Aequorivita marina]|uniref:VOC family protein n=1 Tax=Aequorivita marina TaxID=3073654 RepID=UPI002875A374|nr:VOC family protein [Aequorivita sp. S2608]MDS1298818.1 VOC family protein [Aequorivita sp. S2608]
MKIKKLNLYTSQIDAQKKFYGDTLGLEINRSTEAEISFNAGNTILRFIKKSNFKPYHFAFNISPNKVSEALAWLQERVKIQKDGDYNVVDFPAWNAESIYFYDADNNIVEFIARKNLATRNSKPFTANDILEVSEIGLATKDFKEKYDFLTSKVGVAKFGGGKKVFSALGSETGLFILIDINEKNWFPTNDTAFAADFTAEIELDGVHKTVEFKSESVSLEDGNGV